MGKRLLITVVSIALLLVSACDQISNATPTPITIPESEMATLVSLATEMAISAGIVSPTETPQPVVEAAQPTETATAGPASIAITGIVETAPGKALVSWDAVGDYPSGFKVVWTDVQGLPVFPGDAYVYSSDPASRSAEITGDPGKIYYLRVCRYTGDDCDIYSNLGIFAFQMVAVPVEPTKTLKPTETSKTPKPTTVGMEGSISILLMKGGEDGKAYIQWSSKYNPSSGFKIVYSTSNKTPTYGSDPYFYVPGGTEREAWVDGVQGTTYYYRICGWNGTKCENYSNMYTYKFPGTPATATVDPATLTITGISNVAPGAVQVNWSASGSFPNGYKVVFSQTNPNPTLSDGYVYISSEGTHTAVVENLEPGKLYYFRVCKYSSGCTIYSPTVSFTLAAATTESGFTLSQVNDVAGNVQISWTISPDSAKGYKVMWSTTSTEPTMADSYYYESNPGTHSYTDTASTAGTTYYRICRWSGSYCLSYSNALTVVIVPAP
jgi:hypothetical protein